MELIYVTLGVILIYLIVKGKKALHMLQQNLYDDDFRYFKWLNKNFTRLMLSFALSQVFLIFFILFINKGIIIDILFLIIYLLLIVRSFGISYKVVVKKPLVVTARIKRLLLTIFILILLMIFFGLKLNINYYIILSFPINRSRFFI